MTAPIDDALLAAWFDGLLAPAEEDRLLLQALGSPELMAQLAEIGLALEGDTPAARAATEVPAAVLARTRRAVREAAGVGAVRIAVRWFEGALRALGDALSPEATPAMALRGAAPPVAELRYHLSCDGLPVEARVRVDGERRLALFVRPLRAPASGTRVRLSQDAATRADAPLPDAGLTLGGIEPGRYQLQVGASAAVHLDFEA